MVQPLQHVKHNTITEEERALPKHAMFDRAAGDYWVRLLVLDVDVDGMGEEEKDGYVRDMKTLLEMIDSEDPNIQQALGVPSDLEVATIRFEDGRPLEEYVDAGFPRTGDEARWILKNQVAIRLVNNLKRMRPSRMHLSLPFISLVASNPYPRYTNDPLLLLFRGIALSKLPPAAGKDDEARQTMVTGLNVLGEVGEKLCGQRNMVHGWACLARLLRRTRRRRAAEVIDGKFIEWLNTHPMDMTPETVRFEVEDDDFVPSPGNPVAPPQPMLQHPDYIAWEARCEVIPNTAGKQMLFDQVHYCVTEAHVPPALTPRSAGLRMIRRADGWIGRTVDYQEDYERRVRESRDAAGGV